MNRETTIARVLSALPPLSYLTELLDDVSNCLLAVLVGAGKGEGAVIYISRD